MTITEERERDLTITGADGKTVTVYGDQDKPATEKMRRMVDSLRSASRQLSFAVGGEAVDQQICGSLAISGALPVGLDLDLGDEIRIQVIAQ